MALAWIACCSPDALIDGYVEPGSVPYEVPGAIASSLRHRGRANGTDVNATRMDTFAVAPLAEQYGADLILGLPNDLGCLSVRAQFCEPEWDVAGTYVDKRVDVIRSPKPKACSWSGSLAWQKSPCGSIVERLWVTNEYFMRHKSGLNRCALGFARLRSPRISITNCTSASADFLAKLAIDIL